MQPNHIKKNRFLSPIAIMFIAFGLTAGLTMANLFHFSPRSSNRRYKKGEEFLEEYLRVTNQSQQTQSSNSE